MQESTSNARECILNYSLCPTVFSTIAVLENYQFPANSVDFT